MRVIIAATVIAVALAIGAAFVLDTRQVTVTEAFTTSGVRL